MGRAKSPHCLASSAVNAVTPWPLCARSRAGRVSVNPAQRAAFSAYYQNVPKKVRHQSWWRARWRLLKKKTPQQGSCEPLQLYSSCALINRQLSTECVRAIKMQKWVSFVATGSENTCFSLWELQGFYYYDEARIIHITLCYKLVLHGTTVHAQSVPPSRSLHACSRHTGSRLQPWTAPGQRQKHPDLEELSWVYLSQTDNKLPGNKSQCIEKMVQKTGVLNLCFIH